MAQKQFLSENLVIIELGEEADETGPEIEHDVIHLVAQHLRG